MKNSHKPSPQKVPAPKMFVIVLIVTLATITSVYANSTTGNKTLPTSLTQAEEIKRIEDMDRYPHLMKCLDSIDPLNNLYEVDPGNRHLIKTSHAYFPRQYKWDEFFLSAAKDKVTVLRAFALLARELKRHGVVLSGPASMFENSVTRNDIDLGLAIPAKNMGMATMHPDPGNQDPEFLVHLQVFYTRPYKHRLPDHILPADLKIGYGDTKSYWMNGAQYSQTTIDTDIYYGPKNGIGFGHVKGVGGRKRGVLGFFQDFLFFLPDAVSAMVIDEKTGTMITRALIDTEVKNFETEPKYSIRVCPNGTCGKQNLHASNTQI